MGHTDVVVIGGGIQGASVAEAAAAAGHNVLLLERMHPAYGTSSRSSKLIHGGLRYLESGQIRLVHECLTERRILLERAPELVRLQPFLIPLYRHSRRRPWQIRAGLSLYATLAGFGPGSRFDTLPRASWSTLDGLHTDALRAVFRYHDGQTDDAALTRAVLRSATELGARVLYPARFLGAEREPNGWRLAYEHDGQHHSLSAGVLINAAGPWVNHVLAEIAGAPAPLPVEWVQGTHIVVEGELREGIYYVEAEDGRAVFVMPWPDGVLVGTTETVYRGDLDRVAPQEHEVDYLRRTLARHFPRLARAPVRRAFAGLRVLPPSADSPFSRPRDTQLLVDAPERPSLVTIYGGKLTAARATAERVYRLVAASLPATPPRADTKTRRLLPA